MHREEITDNLEIINESVRLVRTRFKKIEKADDFSTSLEGSILLDAISMRLQVICRWGRPSLFNIYNRWVLELLTLREHYPFLNLTADGRQNNTQPPSHWEMQTLERRSLRPDIQI